MKISDKHLEGWENITVIKVGSFTIEYDGETKELTVSGGIPSTVVCIEKNLEVADIPECTSVVFQSE